MHSSIEFKPIETSDREEVYRKYKSALTNAIEDVFGWNESFQRERFNTHYELNWFYWIEFANERVGYICYWEKFAEFHVSLLIIDSERRGVGYGRMAMIHLHRVANKNNCKVTLSSFRRNFAAVKFYERLGYATAGGDEHFVDMVLRNP